jgi:signal transduction histidine kinase
VNGPAAPGTAGDQVVTTLFRALAVVRFAVMGWAAYKIIERHADFEHPSGAWLALAVIVGWSGAMTLAYDEPRRRTWLLYGADLAVAVALVLATVLVETDDQRARHISHLPSFWVMAVVLAWAVGRGWLAGLVAAAAVSAADIFVKQTLTPGTVENIFLLVAGAGALGWTAQLLKEAVEVRARADHATAVADERARLARAVHDGTLQVLALVQRRGLEAGGDFAELGRLAGEQEAALRSLIRQQEAVYTSLEAAGVDVAAGAERLGEGRALRVSVVTPGRPVVLPSGAAHELLAAAGACLDNVSRHVGANAQAWVLVEDLGDAVVVTVRDDGPGIDSGRLAAAAASGRLGVSESIQGRLAALGGAAVLETGSGRGTEWELRVPLS